MAKGILYRKALRTDLTVKGGLVPIAFGADSVAFGFASPPRARPLSGRGQITTPSPRARSKPELSTLLGSGTFYFALTRATRKAGGDLGTAVRCIRRRLNIGQAGFARSLGWPQATLSQYESGDARPSAERLINLLRIAATDDERRPILKALEAYGVLASDLTTTLLSSPEQLPAPASAALVSDGAKFENAAFSDGQIP